MGLIIVKGRSSGKTTMAAALELYFKEYMTAFYFNNGGRYHYKFCYFGFHDNKFIDNSVDVHCYRKDGALVHSEFMRIENGKVTWPTSGSLTISQEAQDYFERLLKLKAFW